RASVLAFVRAAGRSRAWLPVTVAMVFAGRAAAQSPDHWTTDGVVYAVAAADTTIYLGGQFTAVGPPTGGGAAIDAAGAARAPYAHVRGAVHAVVADGAGGWFIGGSFTAVQGQPRSGLARIGADGTVATWNPGVTGTVLSFALAPGTLYVGG